MLGDLDWHRDLKWLHRLDEDLSYIIECVAQNQLAEAHGGILWLKAWVEASTEVLSSGPLLTDCLRATLTDWHESRPQAVATLVKVKRHARAQLRQLREEQIAEWPPVPHSLQTIDGRYWAPVSARSRSWNALALENPTGEPMSECLHRELTAMKLARLFENAGESDARNVLEMSSEHAAELWAISQSGSPKDWPTMVMHSESMMQLLNYIDWEEEMGAVIPEDHPSQEDIKGSLDEETLWSMLEHL